VDQEVRTESTFIRGHRRYGSLQPCERSGRQEVDRASVEVRNARLPREGDRLAQRGGERGVNVRVVSPHGPAVWEEAGRHMVVIDRLEPKEPIDAAKTARALATAEFAVGISECKESVAGDTTGVHIKKLALLTAQRFHRIAPEPRHDSQCVCSMAR